MRRSAKSEITRTYYQFLGSEKIGGAEKIALSVGDYVRNENIGSSCVFGPTGMVVRQAVQEVGLPFERYDLHRLMRGNSIVSSLECLRVLRKTAFTSGLVHFHSPPVFGAMRLFRGLSGLKSVLHIHLDFTADDLRWAFLDPPDLTIVCADFMRDAVEQATRRGGAASETVRVIRNAVDLRRFSWREKAVGKRALGVNVESPLAMIVANLAPHKGQATCIRAISELRRRGCEMQLWVVGESRDANCSYERGLRDLCAELGVVDLVRFTGFRPDVENLLCAADFVLLPSTSEGLPLSILEAQAAGAIVLAAPTAGIPEVVVDGKTGFLIAADNPTGYSDKLEELVASKAKMIEVCAAARLYIEREHDLRQYCRRVMEEYELLLSSG